jgi:hypothetical protein
MLVEGADHVVCLFGISSYEFWIIVECALEFPAAATCLRVDAATLLQAAAMPGGNSEMDG